MEMLMVVSRGPPWVMMYICSKKAKAGGNGDDQNEKQGRRQQGYRHAPEELSVIRPINDCRFIQFPWNALQPCQQDDGVVPYPTHTDITTIANMAQRTSPNHAEPECSASPGPNQNTKPEMVNPRPDEGYGDEVSHDG